MILGDDMPERKTLASINYVTDTDVGYYEVGEVDGGFDKDSLRKYIESYGHEKLSTHLTRLHFQIMEAVQEINSDKEINNTYSV